MNANKENINCNITSTKKLTKRQIGPLEIINNNYIGGRNIRNKKIKFSNTEIELVNNFPNLNDIIVDKKRNNKIQDTKENYYQSNKSNNINNYNIYELNSARSFKLNYSDFNNYMNRIHNNKINSCRTKANKTNKICLNKYFNIGTINKDNNKKLINKSIKTVYNKYKKYFNTNISHKSHNSYNFYISKNNKTTSQDKMNNRYKETGKIINNNINSNIKIIKKEKELLNLRNILNELKSKNYQINNKLSLLKEENSNLEDNKNNKNKKIFLDIKNLLNKNMMNYTNEKSKNVYNSLKFKEKINYINNIYIEEKLKNSLINKTYLLYNNYNQYKNKNENGCKENEIIENELNLENIYKWIVSMNVNINKLKKNNEKLSYNINNLKEEKEKCKDYYNNWLKMLRIKEKEELIKKIDSLINVKNINENEHAKMIKILMNKKE